VDDYGLGPVRLVYELSRRDGEELSEVIHEPAPHTREGSGTWEWDLSGLDLLPGDTVAYRLEVVDNCALGEGPHSAHTREYVLRFPTLGEIFAEIDESGEKSIEDLRDVADEARRVEKKIEEISREVLKKGESSWENRKEVESALESQQQLAEEMRRVQEDIQSNLDQLAESEFMTMEALQKMQQIQKLLDEVASTEMKEALEKLREAMEESNPRRMQEDLADFQDTQEELMKQLDRIAENLKQFRLEEKMKAAVREMEELAARQERVNDELAHLDEEEKDTAGEMDAAGEESPEDGGEDAAGDESSESEDGSSDESGMSESQDAESRDDSGSESESGEESESSESESGESGSEQERAESGDQESGSESEEGQTDREREMERLAEEEKALSEEAKRLEEQLEEIAEMMQELRDSQDAQQMDGLSQEMKDAQIPQQMEGMAESMEGGQQQEAEEQGEKALTELQKMLTQLQAGMQGMQMRQVAISQAAINRAVRDLLTLSEDQEVLSGELGTIPRNSSSATRTFTDEQYLLLQGAERVESMLEEVAKDTPLMDSQIGRRLGKGLDHMRGSAYGLENGAVQMARDDGEDAIDEMNAVVIALLETVQSMSQSQCASGMPSPGSMQRLQELSQDQEKLNEALQRLRREGGQSMDHRLRSRLERLAEEQRRIQEQLQQLLDEMGEGDGTLGRLDDVERKLDEVAERLQSGELTDELLRDQDWALTRLLDSQRSMRERELGRERQSETGEMADLLPPGALPEGIDELDRDLREDLLKALDRRYPPKYEELIKRYFRSLSREDGASPDLP
jgi:chromosome segregation ATPase